MVLCVKCGREPVTEHGVIKYFDDPAGPLCTDCFYQTPKGREWIERGRRMFGYEPRAPQGAAVIDDFVAYRARHDASTDPVS